MPSSTQGTRMSVDEYELFIHMYGDELIEDYKEITKKELIETCKLGKYPFVKGKNKYYYWTIAVSVWDDLREERDAIYENRQLFRSVISELNER